MSSGSEQIKVLGVFLVVFFFLAVMRKQFLEMYREQEQEQEQKTMKVFLN